MRNDKYVEQLPKGGMETFAGMEKGKMKELKDSKWDDPLDDRQDYFDASANLAEDEEVEKLSASDKKSRVTELRRRIEERLDSKRIDLEFEYDVFDELPDNLQ